MSQSQAAKLDAAAKRLETMLAQGQDDKFKAYIQKLLKEDKVELARQLLLRMKHPTAKRFLDAINAKYPPPQKRQVSRNYAMLGAIAVAAIVLVILGALLVPRLLDSSQPTLNTERDFDGVIMVFVPAGCFTMGSTEDQVEISSRLCQEGPNQTFCELEWFEEEQPAHEVCFDEGFWIDKYEVTQEQFYLFGGEKTNDVQFEGINYPVVGVSWFEARDFCELRGARLPTEAEWEYAARGPESLLYPWGNEWNTENTNWYAQLPRRVFEVGSIPSGASWVGAMDMSGNVSEWTSSANVPYPYNPLDGRETQIDVLSRIIRGGNYDTSRISDLRGSYRGAGSPDINGVTWGIRCVLSDQSPEASESIRVPSVSETATAVYQALFDYSQYTGPIPEGQDFLGIPSRQGKDGAFILGNPDARVTVVAFMDFLCSHCRDYQTTIKDFLSEFVVTGQAQYEFRMLAISQHSQDLFAVAECAGISSTHLFWPAHDYLFAQAILGQININTYVLDSANALGLNYDELLDCTTSADQYVVDAQVANELGVTGIPTLGWRLDGGYLRLDGLSQQPTLDELRSLIANYE